MSDLPPAYTAEAGGSSGGETAATTSATAATDVVLVKEYAPGSVGLEYNVDLWNTTVGELKALVCRKTSVAVSMQNMVFSGTALEDGHSLSHYTITNRATIDLIIHSKISSESTPAAKSTTTFKIMKTTTTTSTTTSKPTSQFTMAGTGGTGFVLSKSTTATTSAPKMMATTTTTATTTKAAATSSTSKSSGILYVKTLTGTLTEMPFESKMTVLQLKEALELKIDAHPARQRLLFSGKQLDDGRLLSDYNIQSGSTLHVVLRMGGATAPTQTLAASGGGAAAGQQTACCAIM